MAKQKKKKTVPVHFPAEHFPPDVAPLEPTPTPPDPASVPDFTAECEITLGKTFWLQTVFVALKSTDGQDLATLLHDGQKVTIHYRKN